MMEKNDERIKRNRQRDLVLRRFTDQLQDVVIKFVKAENVTFNEILSVLAEVAHSWTQGALNQERRSFRIRKKKEQPK